MWAGRVSRMGVQQAQELRIPKPSASDPSPVKNVPPRFSMCHIRWRTALLERMSRQSGVWRFWRSSRASEAAAPSCDPGPKGLKSSEIFRASALSLEPRTQLHAGFARRFGKPGHDSDFKQKFARLPSSCISIYFLPQGTLTLCSQQRTRACQVSSMSPADRSGIPGHACVTWLEQLLDAGVCHYVRQTILMRISLLVHPTVCLCGSSTTLPSDISASKQARGLPVMC